MKNERMKVIEVLNHLLLGGLIKLDNMYTYIDCDNNVRAILMHRKDKVVFNEKTFLSRYEVESITGEYDEDYHYELVNYNGLTLNKLIRLLIQNNVSYLKLI